MPCIVVRSVFVSLTLSLDQLSPSHSLTRASLSPATACVGDGHSKPWCSAGRKGCCSDSLQCLLCLRAGSRRRNMSWSATSGPCMSWCEPSVELLLWVACPHGLFCHDHSLPCVTHQHHMFDCFRCAHSCACEGGVEGPRLFVLVLVPGIVWGASK